jgi:hypothetical protein
MSTNPEHINQLAQPEGEGPSLAEIAELTQQHSSDLGDLRIGVAPEDVPALVYAALARWGHPATPPTLPANYIDPEHQGEALELLQTFYQACSAEGGTADEIHLRGLRAVLAARPATPPAREASNFDLRLIALATTSEQIPPGLYSEHELQTQWNTQADEYNKWESLDSSEQLAWAQVRAIAADRNGRPAAPPAPPSERDVAEWINRLPLWNGASRDELTGIVFRALARWGRPAPPAIPLPQAGGGGGVSKPLSPAAQAAKDDFLANVAVSLEHGLAAAFLASMEHILPLPSFEIGQGVTAQEWCDANRVILDARRKLIDIAAELEPSNV